MVPILSFFSFFPFPLLSLPLFPFPFLPSIPPLLSFPFPPLPLLKICFCRNFVEIVESSIACVSIWIIWTKLDEEEKRMFVTPSLISSCTPLHNLPCLMFQGNFLLTNVEYKRKKAFNFGGIFIQSTSMFLPKSK